MSTSALLGTARRVLVQRAREDFATFCEFVLEDEATGASVELVPMHLEWCRLLDAHSRLVLFAHIESAKTSLAVVGRILFKLGREPGRRMAIVSNTARLAQKVLAVVAKYIATSQRLRLVFPNLVPDPNALWRADAIFVARPTLSRDPSVQAVGVHGALLGSRLDDVLLDDIDDYENTLSPEGRRTTSGWIRSTVFSRLVAGAHVVATGCAWHSEDTLHALEGDGWPTFHYAVVDENGASRWPQRWPLTRIADTRRQLGRRAAANQLDVVPLAEGGKIDPVWVDAALARGARRSLLPHVFSVPDGSAIVVGVDLAVGQERRHDRTCLCTLLAHGNGHRELIAIESGKWLAPEIIRRIVSVNERYRPVTILVESNAAQRYLVDMTKALASSVPVRPHVTGAGKRSLHYGVDGLAVELERGQWTLRDPLHPEVDALSRAITYYDPRAHVDDRLAALVLARVAAEQRSNRVEFFTHDFTRR